MRVFNIAFFLRAFRFGKSEGLLVLLADLIKGLGAIGVTVRIFTSHRLKEPLVEALAANDVPASAYELVTFRVAPFLVTWAERRSRPRRHRQSRWRRGLTQLAEGSLYLLPRLTPFAFWLVAAATAAFVLAFLPVLLPLGFAAWLALALGTRLRAFVRRLVRAGRRRAGTTGYGRRLMDAAFDIEGVRLAERINDQRLPTIYLPVAFSGSLTESLTCRKVLVFPDAVVLTYPTRFAAQSFQDAISNIRRSLKAADVVVCYSEHIRDRELRRHFLTEVAAKDIRVIPHGLYVAKVSAVRPPKLKFENHFPEYCSFIPEYDLADIDYVVYPTVDRPHKNLVSAIRAVAELTRRRYANLKVLFTTHAISDDTHDVIVRERLFHDALFVSQLEEEDFNYVIRHARALINPTFSEGGFPFNFSRAVALGTPAIMSDIPVIRETFTKLRIPPSTYAPWLFDPIDHRALADTIEAVLTDREQVRDAQRGVVDAAGRYTINDMARHYHQISTELQVAP